MRTTDCQEVQRVNPRMLTALILGTALALPVAAGGTHLVGATACYDVDGDGIAACIDNCPAATNPEQRDGVGDDIGNACDTDIDDDGVLNPRDACDFTPILLPIELIGPDGTILCVTGGDCDFDMTDFQYIQPRFTGPATED